MKSNNNYINDILSAPPRYMVMHKGKEVKRYHFYKQARNYCILHNHGVDSLPFPEMEDKVELIDLHTGECLNYLFG